MDLDGLRGYRARMDAVRREILRALEEREATMADASRAMGRNHAYLQQFIHRGVPARLPEDARRSLAQFLNISENQLGARPSQVVQPKESSLIREIDARAGAGGGGFLAEEGQEYVNGISIAADAVRDTWSLPNAYLRGELRLDPERTAIIEVYGDSGYDPAQPGAPGSLFPGDRVIVDMSDRKPSPPGLFAVWDGLGVVLKLVEIVPGEVGRLRLLSRNPSYRPYEVTDGEAHIVGRVRVKISAM